MGPAVTMGWSRVAGGAPALAAPAHAWRRQRVGGALPHRRRLAPAVAAVPGVLERPGGAAPGAAEAAPPARAEAGPPPAAQPPPDEAPPVLRKTKIVATIGPSSSARSDFFALADAGMDVVRLNMSHGTHESHQAVVDLARAYNARGGRQLALMLDTKGPEVRSGDLAAPLELRPGDAVVFTTQEGAGGAGSPPRVSVNYDGFTADVAQGDVLLVDGGLLSFRVDAIGGADVATTCLEGGTLGGRRHLNVRGKSASLPSITEADWRDIAWGVDAARVDFVALSFVRGPEVVDMLRSHFRAQRRARGVKTPLVLAKIESADSVARLDAVLDAADGAMVARGDLGAELPPEDVPYWQSRIVEGCRARGKPVIVATNMLESMVASPAPTRAEVSDISVAVREGADAVMLSGETAYGAFPLKALAVMDAVARRTEAVTLASPGALALAPYGGDGGVPLGGGGAPPGAPPPPPALGIADREISRVIAAHAARLASELRAPLLVFTRAGTMPSLLSHFHPAAPIFAFTESADVAARLALTRGVRPVVMPFAATASETLDAAMEDLKARGLVGAGQLLAVVQSGRRAIWRAADLHRVEVRAVPGGPPVALSDDEGPGGGARAA